MLLLVVAAAITATPLPSEKELGDALAFSQTCIDSDGMTNCSSPPPIGATFAQYLCVAYGADLDKHVIVRCVYKGARMTMRFPFGRTSAVPIGDGDRRDPLRRLLAAIQLRSQGFDVKSL